MANNEIENITEDAPEMISLDPSAGQPAQDWEDANKYLKINLPESVYHRLFYSSVKLSLDDAKDLVERLKKDYPEEFEQAI